MALGLAVGVLVHGSRRGGGFGDGHGGQEEGQAGHCQRGHGYGRRQADSPGRREWGGGRQVVSLQPNKAGVSESLRSRRLPPSSSEGIAIDTVTPGMKADPEDLECTDKGSLSNK